MKKYLLIASVAVMFAGCGVVSRLSKGGGDSGGGMSVNRPAETQRVEASGQGRAESGYALLPEGVTEPATVSEMTFHPLEYQHVRVAGVKTNPLPMGGMNISLDKLAGDFRYPLEGKFISDYGMRRGRPHTGIDIKAAPRDTIRAALPGVVRMSRLYSSYGNIVVIRHYAGFETVYSHNVKNLVKPDDIVRAGDPIALAGRTGRATTEHLHFEVRFAGEPIDPKLVVDPYTMTLQKGWIFVSEKNGRVVAANSETARAQAENDALLAAEAHDAALSGAIASSEEVKPAAAPAAVQSVYYKVKKGDTLSAIAVRNGTTVSKLCSLNSIKSTSLLQINQRLRVK